mgnify:CR=1 FL=1
MPKRRQNGEGTIYQRPNGLWVCEITLGYDENGKRLKKTVSSMDLNKLKKKVNDLKYLNDRKLLNTPENATVSDWLDFWLETYKKGHVKPTTYDMYYNIIKRYLKPKIGHYNLTKLSPIVIQQTINSLSEKGLSTSYLKKYLLTLSQAYQKAIEQDILYKNPCDNIKIPQKAPRESLAFTVEEQDAFLKQCTNSESTYHNLFRFAFPTGLRLGELQALTFDDYNSKTNMIQINKTLVTVNDYNEDSNKKQKTLIESATKTASGKRAVPLNKAATEAFENQRKHNSQNSPFIFFSTAGTPVQKRNIYREFKKLLEAANIISPVTFHSTRHSFATRLLEKGADIKTVSELLGHKSIQITLDIYGHVSADLKTKTINLLD